MWGMRIWILLLSLCLASGCAATRGPSPYAIDYGRKEKEKPGSYFQEGVASFYGEAHSGRPTASGALFDPSRFTAAHRTLPFGTRVRVINLDNGRRTVVTVNDRGPFRKGRVIDVSTRAARALGFVKAGTARVRIEVISG